MQESKTSPFIVAINHLIEDNRTTYKQLRRITADFRLEKSTTKAYNTRQILELLQNADDAQTDVVSIHLDRENMVLSISNNGTPFTAEEGIASLMIANTSSKKKEFIGNKGLGFRSILNWVTEVRIKTKTDIIVFSEKIARDEFELLNKESQKKLIKDNLDHLSENEVPFAILAIPRVYPNKEVSSFETTISLTYKKEEESKIEEQLKLLAPEILLFLNHIETIIIEDSANELTKIILSEEDTFRNRITINEVTWNIEDSEEILYKTLNDKKQYYRYKIAYQDDLSDVKSKFFTHFPTKEYTYLPFLIHATFDLDPSRNHFNISQENIDLLSLIAKALGRIALNKIRSEISNWNAFKFLTPEKVNDNTLLKEFYIEIELLRNTLEIYPCVDGKYRNLNKVAFFGNEFSEFIITNNLQVHFENLLLPNPFYTKGNQNEFVLGEISVNDFRVILKSISDSIDEYKVRAEFIYHLTTSNFKKFHNYNYALLKNKFNKTIPENITAFTPSTSQTIETPEFVSIDIIDKDLYDDLLLLFKEKFTAGEPDARELQRIIKIIVNIQPYDITNITKQIISGTKDKLKELNSLEIVKEMVFVLNYNRHINPNQQPPKEIIPLINKNGVIVNNQDLFLDGDYYSGQLTTDIFEGIYTNNDYLAEPKIWELDNDKNTEDFFIWLGVNRSIKFIEEKETTPIEGYQKYVFKHTRIPDNFNRPTFSGYKIENVDVLKLLSAEKLLLLIENERLLKAQLTVDHEDVFKFKYGSGYPKEIENTRSYIEYQLVQISTFSNYLIDDEIGVSTMFNQIDYYHPLFKKHGVNIDEIKWSLRKLGAINSLNDISLEQFYKLFEGHELLYENGFGSQSFYKKFLEFCTKNKESNENDNHYNFDNFHCFARKGGKGNEFELKLVSEIFYSDNNIVPQNVLDDYWIINLPKRLGEQNVKKYFGVNLMQDELKKIKIYDDKESKLNKELADCLNKLKPYFLCYRLSSLKKKIDNEVVNSIKNLNIKLVYSCSYEINNSNKNYLYENSFLAVNTIYYLKNEDASTIEDLKNEPNFCDAIAEILSIQFKVKEHKNSFRAIFKDSISETEHLIKSDDLGEYLLQAKKLLGISMEEDVFWKNYYKINNKQYPDGIHDKEELFNSLLEIFKFHLPSNYQLVDFNDLSKTETFQFLEHLNRNSPIQLNQLITWETNGFQKYYESKIQEVIKKFNGKFKSLLWEQLKLQKDLQEKFLDFLHDYKAITYKKKVIETIINNALNLNWDYTTYFMSFVLEEYKIDLNETSEIKEFSNLYKKLLLETKIEEGEFTDQKVKSLLYFPNNSEYIISYLNKIKSAHNNFEEEEEDTSEFVGKLLFSGSKPSALPVFEITKGKKKGWSHSSKDVSKNKKAGKKAEKIVYNSLVKEYGKENVEWLSSFSETEPDKSDEYHYDIEYKPKDDEVKFLEVKSFNGSYFYLSREEKKFAEENKDHYEIALVKGKDVHILKNIFEDNIDFYNNKKFKATPSDYIIALKLEN